MVDPKKETKDDRTRRTPDAYDSTRTGDDPSFVAVNTLPTKEAATAAGTRTTGTERRDEKPLTEKVGEKLHDVKEDVKEAVEPDRTADERKGMVLPPRTTTSTTKDVDWNQIQHPGECGPSCDTDYGTRPVSELTPPPVVQDKADLAAVRMMDRDKEERDRLERQRIAAAGITTAAATQAAKTRTGTTTGAMPAGTVDERSRTHVEDPSMHPDWEKQPQINAPQDVGIPTAEGQADAARLRAGQRRSDVAQEPRIDRRGGEYDVPAASSARSGTSDDRSMTQKARDEAYKAKEKTKETARDVKEDVDRKI
jgi:hypothetical protein